MKHLMIISALISMCLTSAFARTTGVQREDPSYTANGNLVVFRAVPKDKTVKLYLVGKESAEMNFQKDAKLLSVTLLEKGNKRKLEFRPVANGQYEISGAPSKGNYNLELQAEVQDQPETATLKIEKP